MRPVLYIDYRMLIFIAFLILLFLGWVFYFSLSIVGFTPLEILIISAVSLLGAGVNIPVLTLKTDQPIMTVRNIKWMGFDVQVPFYGAQKVTVAVNLGGAVVPAIASVYLSVMHISILPQIIMAVVITSLLMHIIARPVRGVGIMTPFFLPPVLAALTSLILIPSSPVIGAYISGTMGALIGADLLNLKKIKNLNASFVSIGGAGIFDGVFVTGLVAALLAYL
ncbi:MAG: DUF1614 domain-containing protein [Nitrososphaerota archaeon]|nr:DUF1614 domain-containing protein [Nitrososphaerota archaeon]MDG6931544.1 DUF1614 domain-containing protein [Nitrososphaerota archaeon]MDG6936022.1 DUF1614 domain-containing protein [Nitrososphaerota archaeon]MDG6944897.1 DUF1614 domain-containing protein [Nitrososphaerota archaeon]